MDQPTTTGEPAAEGAEEAQPKAPETTPAADSQAEPHKDEPAKPSGDDNLAWLESKGISKDDPDWEQKVIENARNAEKLMSKSTQKASELEKSLTDPDTEPQTPKGDPLVGELLSKVQRLELKDSLNAFWAEHPEAKEYEAKMTDIVKTRPEVGELVKAGYLKYDDLYNIARGGDPAKDAELKSQGGKEALEKVAEKQQARVIKGAATTSELPSSVTRENFDSWYSGLSASERAKPETQAIVSSLLS